MAKSDDRSYEHHLSPNLTRRQFLPFVGLAALASPLLNTQASAGPGESGKPSPAEARFTYVGTYTAPGVPPGGTHPSTALGIYVFRMDPSDGGLTLLQVVPALNPSFLALDPSLTHLYSCNEETAGRVSAYAIKPGDGTLSFLNTASANGQDTTHVSVQPSGHFLFAANYTSGNFPVFRILANGS